MKTFFCLLENDLRLLARHKNEWATLMLFFVTVIILLPFALGPEPELLRRLAPGLIWIAVLLMSLLALDRLFLQDARDGTLDLMRLSPLPLPLIVFSKVTAQVVGILAGLALMLPLASVLLGMDSNQLCVLAVSLLLGVPSLVLIGGVVAAVTIAAQRGTALLTLLLTPFYIPILIFAVAATDASAMGGSMRPDLLLEAAILCLLLPLAPLVTAAALKQAD
jgi:heme exporter protein B